MSDDNTHEFLTDEKLAGFKVAVLFGFATAVAALVLNWLILDLRSQGFPLFRDYEWPSAVQATEESVPNQPQNPVEGKADPSPLLRADFFALYVWFLFVCYSLICISMAYTVKFDLNAKALAGHAWYHGKSAVIHSEHFDASTKFLGFLYGIGVLVWGGYLLILLCTLPAYFRHGWTAATTALTAIATGLLPLYYLPCCKILAKIPPFRRLVANHCAEEWTIATVPTCALVGLLGLTPLVAVWAWIRLMLPQD